MKDQGFRLETTLVRLLSTSQTWNHILLSSTLSSPVALKCVVIARGGRPRDSNTAAANVNNPIEINDQRMPPNYSCTDVEVQGSRPVVHLRLHGTPLSHI